MLNYCTSTKKKRNCLVFSKLKVKNTVVPLTARAYLAAAKQAGADLVFTRPFERKDLIQAVDELFGKMH